MNEKKLNDNELKDVNGGQAVLPLRSQEQGEDIAPELVGVNRFGRCVGCGNAIAFPPTGHGTITCPDCGAVNKY